QVEEAFKGSDGAGLDPEALSDPDGIFLDLTVAYLNAPSIGKSLLGAANFDHLNQLLHDGDQAFYLLSTGRFSIYGDDFTPGSVLDRIGLTQHDLPMDARDLAFRRSPTLAGLPSGEDGVMKVFAGAGFDPSQPAQFVVHVTRDKGQIYPEHISRDFRFAYALPANLFVIPEAPQPTGWRAIWAARTDDLALIAFSLLVLAVALARQNALTRDARRFQIFRWSFLAFTLFFIGWRAQAQLSIVNLIGVVKALRGTGSLTFLLYDPPSLLIWAFVLPTLAIWGRGVFCGWLCPFGALQEAIGALAKPLGLRQRELPPVWDRRLRLVKYGVLVAILLAALSNGALAERLADIEPFKTAITLVFVRAWPFVLYAGLLLALNLAANKPFCRYLCPLGAALALGGKLRRWNWLARRQECGSPCQLCAVRCRYGAIGRDGAVDYDECFQCMDCVVIYNDARQCVPRVLEARRATRETRPSPQDPTPKEEEAPWPLA
ncbi:MAG TPA: 4Fe-4S binding protein, partial [Rhodoblastus sp.]|nr:4Fe-4S binding protein [Rhodoblastus sp.]